MNGPHRRAEWHQALDAQLQLHDWYQTSEGKRYLSQHGAANIQPLKYSQSRQLLIEQYASEAWRLPSCDAIFVSREMCEVVDAAAKTFKPEPLLETDLMTTRGFLYFEEPFEVMDRFDNPTTIAAASWTRYFRGLEEGATERAAEMLSAPNINLTPAEIDDNIAGLPGMEAHGICLTVYAATKREPSVTKAFGTLPEVVPLHLTPWYFNMTFDGMEIDENDIPTGAYWWWQIMQVTFRLMQQRVSVKHVERPDRAGRREAKRRRWEHEPEVVVVRLRREKNENGSEPTGEPGNYSHRWIVGGHWRNQPYKREGITRQIWISPHVKGPEDKPLIIKPNRVYRWDR